MIITKNYPQIQLSKINTSTGTLFQSNLFSKSFITNENNVLFVPNKSKLLMPDLNKIKHKNNGYLIEILFHGFNFSAKRYKLRRSKFYIDTHKSEVFICIDPISTDVKSRVHKRRLIFFSYDKDLLTQIEKTIKQFKLPDAYTGKGLFERNDTYTIKQRKKRK